MDATDRIQQIIAPSVEAMGYEIVREQVSGTSKESELKQKKPKLSLRLLRKTGGNLLSRSL